MDVDAVEQGAADAFLLARDGHGRAGAFFDGVVEEAAGAPVRVAVATSFLHPWCMFATSLGSRSDGALKKALNWSRF